MNIVITYRSRRSHPSAPLRSPATSPIVSPSRPLTHHVPVPDPACRPRVLSRAYPILSPLSLFPSTVWYPRACRAYVMGPARCGHCHAPIHHLPLSTHCYYAQL
ncbi:hypothetical protein BD779DRAFT_209666 [Infundibulicybe gibba]|nr:hypothetical protein BD779DRAFT_209666 [Infundibulicybe gibba]